MVADRGGHCKSGGSRIKTCLTVLGYYLILLFEIFAIVIQQYNLLVCVALSLIGNDPTVSHLLTESSNAIAVHLKGL